MEYVCDDPLLKATEAAAECSLSIPALWKGVAAGRLPAPVYPAPRAPRWRLSVLRAAIDATQAMPWQQKEARRAQRIADERDAA